jgi:nitrite reductase/ring-hydroxylating ferredoxin subunit
VSATCPHRGAPLDEGTVEGEIVTCPWHGSRFSLIDGTLEGGPAPTPLRCYEVRVRDGGVEVRSA